MDSEGVDMDEGVLFCPEAHASYGVSEIHCSQCFHRWTSVYILQAVNQYLCTHIVGGEVVLQAQEDGTFYVKDDTKGI